jgi:hypothetical protein
MIADVIEGEIRLNLRNLRFLIRLISLHRGNKENEAEQ